MARNAWGPDVSFWKDTIDWKQVAAAGASFGIAKCTDGFGYVDSQWAANREGIKKAGLVRGGFHYFQATDDPVRQATDFIRVLQLEPGDFPPIIDVEEKADINYPDGVHNLKTFVDTVEILSAMKPIIYTGISYWSEFHNFVPPLWCKEYPLWISLPSDGDAPSQLAQGWNEWMLWQSSWTGRVPGIQNGQGDVDMNWFNGTAEDLAAWIAKVNPKKPSGRDWRLVGDLFRQGKIAEALAEVSKV